MTAAAGAARRLVVTADDVGLHAGLTRGALAAHDQGLVTACSVTAVGNDVAGAVSALRERPSLDAGAHLVLVGERPLSPPGEIPTLAGRDGRLPSGFARFAALWLAGRIDPRDVRRELARQIEALLTAGLRLVHLNSHQHVHALPGLRTLVLDLAVEHGIRWVRVPHESEPGAFVPRSWALRVMNACGRGLRRELGARAGLTSVATTLGIRDAGHLDAKRILDASRQCATTAELVCHPGLGEAELRRAYGWGYAWERETIALRDPALRAAFDGNRVRVVSFSALEETAAPAAGS